MAWVIPLGVLLSGLGLAGVGVAYELTCSRARQRPRRGRLPPRALAANYVSGRRRATGMARFGVGNVGFAWARS